MIINLLRILLFVIAANCIASAGTCWALASNNIPLDSQIYTYLDKLAGFGLIKDDFRGIRPLSRAEAARLVLEAESNNRERTRETTELANSMLTELHQLLVREVYLYSQPDKAPRLDYNPFTSYRLRYIYLDGIPRSYERPVHDPGGDGVFGIGSGLRPDASYPSPAQQHGSEGTPLLENNEGIRYTSGSNTEMRFTGEVYLGNYATGLLEPLLLYKSDSDSTSLSLNKVYAKLGGGGLELEVGRDSNWLGLGYRGNITLTNNARNFDIIKLSSPEPINIKYLGDIKYAFIFSRFDRTIINGVERRPYFLGAKFSLKPIDTLEFGINLGRQAGGTGVNNGLSDTIRGLVGGTNSDNSNSVAGLELRYRLPFLRNAEVYGEFSGEDSATFWPIVESYVGGIFVPRLTDDGRNDLRFEYFNGNRILYTNGTFPEGYLYQGVPIGHSQGGAAQEFFVRCSHWFSVRQNLAVEYMHGERGNTGRVAVDNAGNFKADGVMQAVERKNSWRAFWKLPLYGDYDVGLMYGWERIANANLVAGVNQTNQLFRFELSYRY